MIIKLPKKKIKESAHLGDEGYVREGTQRKYISSCIIPKYFDRKIYWLHRVCITKECVYAGFPYARRVEWVIKNIERVQ